LTTRVNRSVAEALGAHAPSQTAAMMPAIAVALERRNSLETSGFGAHALRRLGVNPQPNRASDDPRAIAGPDPRETGARETGARETGTRDGGRLTALPLKGA
jgi:hypothetical protein